MPQTKCGFDSVPGGANGSHLLAAIGPTLFVDIGFDPKYDPKAIPLLKPVPGITNISALVDTGATESCIDNLLAAELKLPIADKRPIAGVHGSKMANMHLAQIHVPSLAYTIYGMFAGVDLAAGGQQHKALIGRTFLMRFRMVYEGDTGTVTLTSI
jgi:hypothetical protein